jgi:hypothetical protein
MMLAATDLVVSVAGSFGFPVGGTWTCAVQAVLEIFFLRANWLWTTLLVYQMYRFVVFNKIFLSELAMHGIVWPLSALLTFLPLVHAEFGRDGSNTNSEMCFLTSTKPSWFLSWLVVDWIGVLFVCIWAMIYFIQRIGSQYKDVNDSVIQNNINALVSCLYAYPAILALTWGSNGIINLVIILLTGYRSPTALESYIISVTAIVSLSNGLLISLVFFTKSPEARYRWKVLLRCKTAVEDDVPHEYDETSSEPSLLSDMFLSECGMRSSLEIA